MEMVKSYGLSGVEVDREKWLRYAMLHDSFVREECEEIFQDCLLHCWLTYDSLSFTEWRQEYRLHLYRAWKVNRGWRDRYLLELDAPVSSSIEDDRCLADVLPENDISVELKVICRQEGAVLGDRFWDEYEKLNKSHKRKVVDNRRVSYVWR